VAAGDLKPAYLLTGTDVPKIELALRRLRTRFEQGSIEQLSADSASGAAVVAAANALGLFGGGERLVVVDAIERWKKHDVEAVVAYLANPTLGAVLALVGDPSRLQGLEEACKSAGEVLRYDVPMRRHGRSSAPDYVAWVVQRLERLGLRVSHEAGERLVELVGDDVTALQSEIDKLIAWSESDAVGVADVERLVAAVREENVFALGDAWGVRDGRGALAACEAALMHDEPYKVAGRLADHVRGVSAVFRLLEEDLGVREIAERLGLKEYPARKRAAQAANFSAEELGRAVVRLAALDHALKGGSRLDPVLELERAVAEISATPGRRAP
jgi:DNA polymerase-3 subunit delta